MNQPFSRLPRRPEDLKCQFFNPIEGLAGRGLTLPVESAYFSDEFVVSGRIG